MTCDAEHPVLRLAMTCDLDDDHEGDHSRTEEIHRLVPSPVVETWRMTWALLDVRFE